MSRQGSCTQSCVLLLTLTVATWVPHGLALSQDRCIYPHGEGVTHVILNLTQSTKISCFSGQLHGSVYHHLKVPQASSPLAEASSTVPWDILRCEAPHSSMLNLNLYLHADRDGLQVVLSPEVPCMAGSREPNENCTVAMLYVNVTHYDRRNDSTIPVCGLSQAAHNLECYCIHYILDDTTCASHDRDCASTTEPDITSTASGPRPSLGAQGQLAEAFKGTVPVLLVVTVALLVLVAIQFTVIVTRRKKKRFVRPTWSDPMEQREHGGEITTKFPSQSSERTPKKKGRTTTTAEPAAAIGGQEHPDGTYSDDEHDRMFAEETHVLLMRSKSCPEPPVSTYDMT